MAARHTAEGAGRLGRARAEMARLGLDALFLASGPNLAYLSGYPSIERTLARPFFLLVPARDEPVLIVHTGREFEACRYSWVDDIRTYPRLSAAPVDVIRDALQTRGVQSGRLGAELGFEQRLGMPVLEFDRIRDAVAPAEIVDAAPLLWHLRATKTPTEIEAMRRACRITADAYREVFASLRSDMYESDVALRLKEAMLHRGGSDPWVAITSGRGNYDLATGAGSPRRLVAGDMVWADAGCAVEGYWSDFGRAAVLGPISQERRELQQSIHEITMAGVALTRPGNTTGDIAREVNRLLARLGVDITSSISGLAGRVGHGVGLDVTEPPHVAEYDETPLEPGMVVTVEPGVATTFGIFHVEEQVLITEGEPEVLSAAPREIVEVAV